jgi:hypothetical protein
MLQSQETRALDTMAGVLASLRAIPNRDDSLNCLIGAIEDDCARLLALTMGSRHSGRVPPRMSTAVEPWLGGGAAI